jgi:hypothetical protein
VAEGGNQTIVGVGVPVSVGMGVAVGSARFTGKQAVNEKSPQRRNRIGSTFIKKYYKLLYNYFTTNPLLRFAHRVRVIRLYLMKTISCPVGYNAARSL